MGSRPRRAELRTAVGVTVAEDAARFAVGLSGAAISAAAVAIALGYFPALDAPFIEPKLAVLVVAGAIGLGAHLLARGDGSPRPRWPRALAVATGALLLTTVVAAWVAARRRPPGAPYAAAEIIRWLAVWGVALGTAQLATAEAPAASGRATATGVATAGPNARGRARLFEAIHAGACLVSLLGLLQHLRWLPFQIPSISVPGSTFGNRNLAAEAVAAAIPFGLGRIRFGDGRRTDAPSANRLTARLATPALALALELGYLAVARARGAWLGGALGIAVFFALRRPRVPPVAYAAAIAIMAAALLAAIIPGRWTAHDARDAKRFAPATEVVREAVDPGSPVARTRIGLWRRTLALYREHPLWGVGPGNFAVVFPRFAEPGATRDGVLSATAVPRRAHDDLLERLAETGPFGLGALLAVYAAAASLAVARARARRRAPERQPALQSAIARLDDARFDLVDGRPAEGSPAAASAGCLAAIAGCGLTGFPLAMPATAFLFGVALGVLATGDAPASARAPALGWRRATAAIAALLILAGAVWWSERRLAASYLLARADASLRAGDAPADAARALPLLARAAENQPGAFAIALRTAYAAARAGRAAESLAAAERAREIEPDAANGWEALARARLDLGDARGADAAAGRALEILHDYPGALYTRALAAGRLGEPARAADARGRLAALAATDRQARRLADALAAGAR
jgi:O-antigen ligase